MKHTSPIVAADCEHYRSLAEMPLELNDRLRLHARKFGDTYASYLATEASREYFWAPKKLGVVAFCRRGRYLNVADGLLAASEDREQLLTAFLAFAEQNHWVASFMNVPRNEINMFRNQGCQVTKCGEEAIIQLDQTDWQGKNSQWLRRQENYCRRHGVEVSEVTPDPADPAYQDEVVPQLKAISRDHIASTLHRREMQFFVSHFSADMLGDRRLFVARKDTRIIAFIVCNPGLNDNFWAVEVYRRSKDAVRGVIPCVIMHAMRKMKAEGVQYFSLSLVPFLRCNPVRGDSPVFRFAANFWWRNLNSIFDVQGIFHFKSRFRPDYREMYLAVHPATTIRSLLVIAYIWKLFHFNPLRLLKRNFRFRRGSKQRSLAMPEQRSKRAIRQLRHKPDPNDALPLPVTTLSQQKNDEIHAHEDLPI